MSSGRVVAHVDEHDDTVAVVIARPFELIAPRSADGWSLVAGSPVQSYGL